MPPAKRRPADRPAPRLGGYRELIDEWLIADQLAPRKQRHTAKRIWKRLLEEDRLGIEGLVDRMVDLGERAGAANPGRKVTKPVSAMTLGADCIDDCEVLRSGQTRAVLGHRVWAPSTLGTFLRAFTFGMSASSTECLPRACRGRSRPVPAPR